MDAGSPNTRNLWGILCLKIRESRGIPFAIEWEMQTPYCFFIQGKGRVVTQYWSWSRGKLVKTLGTKWNFLLYIFVSITFQGKAVQGRGWREIAAYHLCHFSNDSTFILSFPAYVESQILAPSGCSYVKLQQLLLMTDPFGNLHIQIFTHRHGLS